MLTDPDRVKRLPDWCVERQLAAEVFIYEGIDVPEGWGAGIMGSALFWWQSKQLTYQAMI